MNQNLIVGISIGDFNGIGIEVILKTFQDSRVIEQVTPIIYGKKEILDYYINLDQELNISFEIIKSAKEVIHNKINLINISNNSFNCSPGEITIKAGEFAYNSLKCATDDISKGLVDVLVTAPINKTNIQSKDFNFPGHTEFLTSLSNIDQSLMFMVDQDLRVGLATNHIEIKKISSILSSDLILKKLSLMNHSLINDFNIQKPKIAVLGLNPHSGDLGLIGKEEIDIISPAISKAKEEGIFAWGPFPADGFFGNGIYGNFDGVLAMYHDQGLIPFKTISKNKGVNFTAGLPIVRTSPDHGTGMDISGKGIAEEASFRNAVFLAKDIFKNRNEAKKLKEQQN